MGMYMHRENLAQHLDGTARHIAKDVTYARLPTPCSGRSIYLPSERTYQLNQLLNR